MLNSEKMVQKIKTCCKENNIKISDLEETVGLSTGNLSRWAKACPAPIKTLYEIAEVLNISVDYLLDVDTTSRRSSSDEEKQQIIESLIAKTKEKFIEWNRISSPKAKKIPVINFVNEIVYNSYIKAFETIFNDYHLIFIHNDTEKSDKLYIDNNNDYVLIGDNNYLTQKLYNTITQCNDIIISDLFKDITSNN